MERGSGGTAERKAALLIELRGGIQVESCERSDPAEAILRDVLQASIAPGVGDSEKNGAIAAHKNKFRGRRGRFACDRAFAPSC